jgi:guanylate kinase
MIAAALDYRAPLAAEGTTMPELDPKTARGPLIIVSGPSGSGKSTLIRRVLAAGNRLLRLSVSATTRQPRPSETDGVDYYFWPKEKFEAEIRANGFLEHAQVHDNYYGSLKREVEPYLERGVGVVLDIDVQGAEQVRKVRPEAVSVFVHAGSMAVVEQRLRQRGTESEASIARRLANASRELGRVNEYDYVIENDDLESAAARLEQIIGLTFKGDLHAR